MNDLHLVILGAFEVPGFTFETLLKAFRTLKPVTSSQLNSL